MLISDWAIGVGWKDYTQYKLTALTGQTVELDKPDGLANEHTVCQIK